MSRDGIGGEIAMPADRSVFVVATGRHSAVCVAPQWLPMENAVSRQVMAAASAGHHKFTAERSLGEVGHRNNDFQRGLTGTASRGRRENGGDRK